MTSTTTLAVGLDFIHQIQTQNPFLINTAFPMTSNLSAFPYFQEREEATPAAFNDKLSIISANIAAIDSNVTLAASGATYSFASSVSIGRDLWVQGTVTVGTKPSVATRTAVNIEPETIAKLAGECKNIVAIKEASGSLDQMARIVALCGKSEDGREGVKARLEKRVAKFVGR